MRSALRPKGFALGRAGRRVRSLGLAVFVVGWGAVLSLGIPKGMRVCGESKEQIAQLTVAKYVLEALPSWQEAHHRRCPDDLAELNEYMNNKDTRDPWGRDYLWSCRRERGLPLVVISAGPDGRFGTHDDIGYDP